MISSRVLRPLLISAATVVTDATKTESECVCRPSELPMYTKEVQNITSNEISPLEEPGPFESTVGTLRRGFISTVSQVKQVVLNTQEYAETSILHASNLIAFLQQEENVAPRYGAVAIGGLSGYIFGLRGGIIKKFVYTSAGALSIAAICYPAEASKYSQIGLGYAMIAYNFMIGVKKDDPPINLPSLPKLPTSVSEAWDLVNSFSNSNSVSESKEEAEQEVNLLAVNPTQIITDAHDQATNQSCKCSIDPSMGLHDESNPPK